MRTSVILLLAIAPAWAQTAPASPDVRAKVDAVFARFHRTDSPGCAVGVANNDRPVLSAAYGMADLEHDVPLTPDSIFEPGSVTKQFTAAAVLLLAQQGKLSLEDPVRKYIPELPEAYAPVTLRHMLNHTAGLRDWGSIEAIAGWPRTTRAYTTAHMLDILSRQRTLNYPPGVAYSYSNSGYNLAAVVVERVSGKSLADFTRESIFVPLGMTSTSWRDDFRRIVKGRAIAYEQTAGRTRQLMPFEDIHGQGGLLTTVGDLLRWNSNFQSKRVGGPGFVDLQLVRGKLTNGVTIGYAAGLMVLHYNGFNEVSHSGTTAAYNAWLGRYPDQRLSVAVLCNSSAANGTQLGRAVAEIFLGGPDRTATKAPLEAGRTGMYRSTRDHSVLNLAAGADASHYLFEDGGRLRVVSEMDETVYEKVEPWTPSAADLAALTGDYVSDEAEVTLTIAIDDGKLVLRRRPDTKIALRPTYRDGFQAAGMGSVRFLRDPSGKVTELSVGEARVWDLRFRRR
jgi:CubicO group peptidase (beta-lactamase class C family)